MLGKENGELLILAIIGITLILGGLIGSIAGINTDSFSADGACETCRPDIIPLYSAAALVLGIIALGIFAARKKGMDISWLYPSTKKGIIFWTVAVFTLMFIQVAVSPEANNDDTYSHFLNAKQSWKEPVLFFELFHKPVFNFIGSFPAQAGFFAYRLFFAALSIGAALFAFLSARELGFDKAWIAFFITAFSPIFFWNSVSAQSEIVFGLFSIAAFYFFIRKKPCFGVKGIYISSFLVSMLPFVRYEGIFFAAILGIILLWRRDFKAIALMFVFPIAFWLLGSAVWNDPLWLINQNQNFEGAFTYKGGKYSGGGPISWYFEKFNLIVGAAGALLFQLGLIARPNDKRIWVAAVVFLSYFLLHVYSWSFGSFGALGLIVYFGAIIPIGAVIISGGIDVFLEPKKLGKKKQWFIVGLFIVEAGAFFISGDGFLEKAEALLFAGTAILFTAMAGKDLFLKFANESFLKNAAVIGLIVITILSGIVYVHPPVYPNAEHRLSMEVADWLQENGYKDRPLLSTMGFLKVFSGMEPFGGMSCDVRGRLAEIRSTDCMYSSFTRFKEATPGTILVYDPHYSKNLLSVSEEGLSDIEKAGYTLIKRFSVDGSNRNAGEFLIFEKK